MTEHEGSGHDDAGHHRAAAATPPGSLTTALRAFVKGDAAALAPVADAIYAHLHEIATRQMRRERPGHTLQPTALVHESLLRLLGNADGIQDRAHFLRLAARAMRHILIDHARRLAAVRHGGALERSTLDEAGQQARSEAPDPDWIDLDQALAQLEATAVRAAQVAEMHYFAGMTHGEVSHALSISVATAERDLRFAKAFLASRLRQVS